MWGRGLSLQSVIPVGFEGLSELSGVGKNGGPHYCLDEILAVSVSIVPLLRNELTMRTIVSLFLEVWILLQVFIEFDVSELVERFFSVCAGINYDNGRAFVRWWDY